MNAPLSEKTRRIQKNSAVELLLAVITNGFAISVTILCICMQSARCSYKSQQPQTTRATRYIKPIVLYTKVDAQ